MTEGYRPRDYNTLPRKNMPNLTDRLLDKDIASARAGSARKARTNARREDVTRRRKNLRLLAMGTLAVPTIVAATDAVVGLVQKVNQVEFKNTHKDTPTYSLRPVLGDKGPLRPIILPDFPKEESLDFQKLITQKDLEDAGFDLTQVEGFEVEGPEYSIGEGIRFNPDINIHYNWFRFKDPFLVEREGEPAPVPIYPVIPMSFITKNEPVKGQAFSSTPRGMPTLSGTIKLPPPTKVG